MFAMKDNHRKAEIDVPRSLTARASLGAVSNALTHITRVLVGLAVTPIIVRGLGLELYGAWTMIQQTLGYVALADLRATSTVKFTLAASQHEEDFHGKRQQVGASLLMLRYITPLLLGLGAIVTGFSPYFIRTNPQFDTHVRLALLIGIVGILVGELSSIPGNILRGVNLEYKAMGLNALVTALTMALSAVAIWLGAGLPGLALAGAVGPCVTGAVRYFIARAHVPWLGAERPPKETLQWFWRRTTWIFLASLGVVMQNSTDLLVVGIVLGPSAAALYGATGMVLRMCTESFYSIIAAANPGIAGLCGQSEWERVERIRRESYLVACILSIIVGVGVLALNKAFLILWLGPAYYGGDLLNLLLVVITLQNIPLRLDVMLMDGMLKFRERALSTIAASTLGLALGALLGQGWGVEGVALGIIMGRILAIAMYHTIIKQGSGIKVTSYVAWMSKPLVVGVVLLSVSWFVSFDRLDLVRFVGIGGATSVSATCVMWFVGLSEEQRSVLTQRFGAQLTVFAQYVPRRVTR